MTENGSSVNCKIDGIETTNDCLSSRAGLTIIQAVPQLAACK